VQTKGSDLINELIRQVIQACSQCRHGKATMECRRNLGQCHNRKVREWRKKIEQIQMKREATLCQKNESNKQHTNQGQA